MRSILCWLAVATACSGSEEPPSVQLPVVVDANGVGPATPERGYTVTVTELRAAIRDLELTIGGETHEAIAYAHPGHAAAGDVTGELRGAFVVDWTDDGARLGDATLLTGRYDGANFTFRKASAEADRLDAGDPLDGHTLALRGSIARDGDEVSFELVLDIDDDTQLVGAPFELDVTETTDVALGLQLATVDPVEGDTLFDGVDFFALDDDGDRAIAIAPGDAAHNRLRRIFQTHDHYLITSRTTETNR